MKKVSILTTVSLFLLILFIVLVYGLTSTGDLPEGWFKAGNAPMSYESGVDNTVFHTGKSSGYIKSITNQINGFGTLMQLCKADKYLDKRVRLSAYVKSENINEWAGVWLRIDDSENKPLGFDNMQERPIKGTSDWKKYEIVLDIPKESVNLAFGVLLQGTGKIWMDDLKFEIVDKSVPLTVPPIKKESPYPDEPVALGFEK